MGYDELGIVLSNAILSDFDKKIKYGLSLEECLRNRYVHSGYYIKNNSLRITFKDLDEKTSKLKNYTLNNVDVKWIYERIKILYTIVIDIIFKNMLEYKKYRFKRMF